MFYSSRQSVCLSVSRSTGAAAAAGITASQHCQLLSASWVSQSDTHAAAETNESDSPSAPSPHPHHWIVHLDRAQLSSAKITVSLT